LFFYDVNGVQEWVARFTANSTSNDIPTTVATDKDCNVYITGFSSGNSGGVVIKYDSDGNQQWIQTFETFITSPVDMAVDKNGNIFITGSKSTIKYNTNGQQQWTSSSEILYVAALALDNVGNVIIMGVVARSGLNNNVITIKYDSFGNELWRAFFDPGTGVGVNAIANDVAVDLNNNIYITGSTGGVTTSIGVGIITIKYNPNGQEQWTQTFQGVGNSDDRVEAITVNDSGEVHIVGSTNLLSYNSDIVTVKYSTDGILQWVQQFDGSVSREDQGKDIVLDNDNNVYITGIQGKATSSDFITISYSPTGDFRWQAELGSNGLSNTANALDVDSIGNVYVTGFSSGGTTRLDMVTVKYAQNEPLPDCCFIPASTEDVFVSNGMLCFSSQAVFQDIATSLSNQQASFSTDNGNTSGIISYINSSPPPGQLKDSLLNFTLLSDTVLITLLNAGLPPGILKQIFLKSAPFTDFVIDSVTNFSLPPGIKKQILDASDSFVVISDPILDAFENSLGFTSLRTKLIEEEVALLSSGVDPQVRDIDAFFIQDDILRTVLNSQLEVQIGNSIYKFADDTLMLEIKNNNCFDALGVLRTQIAIPLTLANDLPSAYNVANLYAFDNVTVHRLKGFDGTTSCDTDFKFSLSGTSTQIAFNSISSDFSVRHLWDFGDGCISSAVNPVHAYDSLGEFEVTLSLFDSLGCSIVSNKKTVKLGTCNSFFDPTTTIGSKFVSFTDLSTSTNTIVAYVWDFGDSASGSNNTSLVANTSHTYSAFGIYTARLIIIDDVGCRDTSKRTIFVKKSIVSSANCCSRQDKNKDNFVTYDSDTRRFKSKIWLTNVLVHRVAARTVNYKKKLGVWLYKKTDRVETTIIGKIFIKTSAANDCANAESTMIEVPNGENNRASQTAGFKIINNVLWLKEGSVLSIHSINFNGSTMSNNLSLTDNCD